MNLIERDSRELYLAGLIVGESEIQLDRSVSGLQLQGVTVLRDGESIGTKRMDEVDRAELIHMMVGRELGSIFPKREIVSGDVVLELRDVSSRAAGIHHVSLSVRKGEILGIAGLVGSGRTQVAET